MVILMIFNGHLPSNFEDTRDIMTLYQAANEGAQAWPKRRETLGGNDFLVFTQ